MQAVSCKMQIVPYQKPILRTLHDKLPAACCRIYQTIDDFALTELVKIHDDMKRTFKPMKHGRSFDSYFFRYAPMRLVRVFFRRYRPLLNEVSLEDSYRERCEEDDRDGVTRHKYGRWNKPESYSIYADLELRDLCSEIEKHAKALGLRGITKCIICEMTEQNAAKVMRMPRSTYHKRLAKFRRMMLQKKSKFLGTKLPSCGE